jgi:hypothetical protein
MAANKKALKSGAGSTPKKKASAPQRAQERAQRQQHIAEPRVPRSHKLVDQSRFPGETALTGEDRPNDRPHRKQKGHAQDVKPVNRGGRNGSRTEIPAGEQSLRAGRQKKRASARAD